MKMAGYSHNDEPANIKATYSDQRFLIFCQVRDKQVSTEVATVTDLQNGLKRKVFTKPRVDSGSSANLFARFSKDMKFPDAKMELLLPEKCFYSQFH